MTELLNTGGTKRPKAKKKPLGSCLKHPWRASTVPPRAQTNEPTMVIPIGPPVLLTPMKNNPNYWLSSEPDRVHSKSERAHPWSESA